jgi:thiol-disulfide isomerase/thioredoxin
MTRLSLLIASACLVWTCQDPEPVVPARQPAGTGFKVVPAGASPARAAGPKGVMIDMDNDELRVILVNPKGPAADAGFAPGDRILAGDGQDLTNEDDLNKLLAKTAGRKIYFEVRSGQQILTLPLQDPQPGWLVLSGDSFKGYLLTRIQAGSKIPKPVQSGPAPELQLPGYDGPRVSLRALRPHPVAILFWGTFSEPSYAHLQAFAQVCKQYAPRGLRCLAIDTLELFTAVGKTAEYAAEMDKVRREIYPVGTLAVDLFMESERQYGVTRLPTLVLIDSQGQIAGRQDGPLADPFRELPDALGPIVPASPIE